MIESDSVARVPKAWLSTIGGYPAPPYRNAMGLWLLLLADGQHHWLPPPPEYEQLAGYEPNLSLIHI